MLGGARAGRQRRQLFARRHDKYLELRGCPVDLELDLGASYSESPVVHVMVIAADEEAYFVEPAEEATQESAPAVVPVTPGLTVPGSIMSPPERRKDRPEANTAFE